MTAHPCTDTITAPYKPKTAHRFIVRSFPDIGKSPVTGLRKNWYHLRCNLLPAYSRHVNTDFHSRHHEMFSPCFYLSCYRITHSNYHQIYLLVLSILHVAASTARYSAPSSIYDGALAILVQPSSTLWRVMIDTYYSFPTHINTTQNRSSYCLYF
jgi:hypothetical protein